MSTTAAGPSWRGLTTQPVWTWYEACIITNHAGRNRNYEVYVGGKQIASRHSLDEAKAVVEDEYGPQNWERIALPKIEVEHYWWGKTKEFTDPLTIYTVMFIERRKTATAGARIARGLTVECPTRSLALKLRNGTANAHDILSAIDPDVGIWWGRLGTDFDIEDIEVFAYTDELVRSWIEEPDSGEVTDEQDVFGEIGIVLVAEHPIINGEPWDPELHPPQMGGLMGQSFLPSGTRIRLTEVRYNAGWGWKTLAAQGITVTSSKRRSHGIGQQLIFGSIYARQHAEKLRIIATIWERSTCEADIMMGGTYIIEDVVDGEEWTIFVDYDGAQWTPVNAVRGWGRKPPSSSDSPHTSSSSKGTLEQAILSATQVTKNSLRSQSVLGVNRELPHSGMFCRGNESLDPRLFDGDTMRLEVVEAIMDTIDGFWTERYPGWERWARVYVCGSAASYWWDSDSDLDVLIGIDKSALDEARPQNIDVTEAEVCAHLSREFKEELDPLTTDFLGGLHATFYVNEGSYNITQLMPYAAYCVSRNEWAVHPPQLPEDWGPQNFPDQMWRDADNIADAIEDLMDAPEPDRTMIGVAKFDVLHDMRRRAYAPGGLGWLDFGNMVWQALSQWGVLQKLYKLKHPELVVTASSKTARTVYRVMTQGEWDDAHRKGYFEPSASTGKSLWDRGGFDVLYAANKPEVMYRSNDEPHLIVGFDSTRDGWQLGEGYTQNDLDMNDRGVPGTQVIFKTHQRVPVSSIVSTEHLASKTATQEPDTSQALRVWNGTDIERLKVHLIVDGHAACDATLRALFRGNNGEVTCSKCLQLSSTAAMQWQRRPYGVLSSDREFFLERGARMSEGGTAWLIWRKARAEEYETDEHGSYSLRNGEPLRKLHEITGAPDGDEMYIDTHYEGASLAEAKDTAEFVRSKKTSKVAADYWGGHRPMEDQATLDDLTKGLPDDVYEHPEYYAYSAETYFRETVKAIRAARGKPNATVRIFRAAPSNTTQKIERGDWVALSEAYCRVHARHPTDESKDMPVYYADVKVSDVRWGGDDLNEYGYWGPPVATKIA